MATLSAEAKDQKLVLKWEQHWPTYEVGGTCNFGSQNFFVGDVDNDGISELITSGLTYNGSYTDELEAPFRIWNWNGQNFTLEASKNWPGTLHTIYAADLNGDSKLEIISGTNFRNGTNSIRIWIWDNKDLALLASYDGIHANSIFVRDLDYDSKPEILAAGAIDKNETKFAQLSILRLEENNLFLVESFEWRTDGDASANSVFADDLDNDGVVEIVTGGYDNGLTNSSGQLHIWQWSGQKLQMKTNEQWQMMGGVYGVTVTGAPMGNTLVENLKVGDVDSDGTPEIVTGGFTYDGEKVIAQLRIWNWYASVLTLEKSYDWFTKDINDISAISLNDVNADGHIEIVTSGGSAVYGGWNKASNPENAFLRIWSWDGKILKLDNQEEWVVGEGTYAWNVATGDINKDGITEIITVGCMYVKTLCDPDLRIWYLQNAPSYFSLSTAYVIVSSTILLGVITGIVLYVFIRRRRTPKIANAF